MKLNPNFMAELFKLMYHDINIMQICYGHLTYELIPKEWPGYKFLLKEAIEQFGRRNTVPSLGAASQKYDNVAAVQKAVKEIKDAAFADKELMIDQLEVYIRDTEFQLLNKKIYDLYDAGKKEEAIKLSYEESKRILQTSLRETGGNFIKIFKGFKERQQQKRRESENAVVATKVPFGIDRLDELCGGGVDVEDTVLWIMRSGVGKSTVLRYCGYNAAVEGLPVLHIQLEEGKEACADKYDRMWTNQSYPDIKKGFLKEEDREQIEATIKNMTEFGFDIDVYGFKTFGEASVHDVRNIVIEYEKINGHFPKLLLVDSIDLLKTGEDREMDNNPKNIKYKLQKCAQRLKDMAVEFKMVVMTAAQTGDVPFEVWNNEDKVIDRSHTEGDKTLVKPFSFVFTGNITIQEKKENKARIYVDKLRDYTNNGEIIPIITDFSRGRFYNRKKTMEMYQGRSFEKKPEKPEKEKLGRVTRI